jgi:large subunit ribosomal protein L18|tara:strand:+ start:162 stop:515 length:354 start_codon:yes stop_codon:yes gene_type:complete
MKIKKIDKKKFRIRNKIKKISANDRFRLSVNRSTRNISAQIIDDKNRKTLVSATSISKDIKSQKKNKKELSTLVAEELAKKAKEKKITKVYFDRGGYKYHGRIKLLADELRKNGLEF